uniref:EF-hand domain-containing protein n=1 Tax=Peronospora matthiolae TaxID=2874970 RepID=A0AAV1U0Y1_9STRA
MRRLTTATPASRLPLARLFKRQPIEELLELRSILAAQNLVAKIHENPIPRRLNESDAYLEWVKRKCRSKSSVKQMDKTAFDAFVKDVSVYLQQQEEQVFNECGKIGPMEEEELSGHKAEEFVEAVKLKMARHMCMQTAMSFELLDKDKDGKVHVDEVEKLLQVVAHGNGTKWMKSQFDLYGADGDNVVNETESRLILDSMVTTQKAVMAEIFATHVDNMPKKCEKLVAKSLREEDFRSKIPEKVRCVFHFANKLDKEHKTYDWELFEDSQKAEFPELHNLLTVYAKGFYTDRFMFHERKQERRSTRYKGLLLAAAIGLGDYIAAVI